MVWRGGLVSHLVEEASERGVRGAGESLLSGANEHVPFETGELMDSGEVGVDGDGLGVTAIVSYDTGYAIRLHEHPEYHFQGQGKGKWVEDEVNEQERSFVGRLAKPLIAVFKLP